MSAGNRGEWVMVRQSDLLEMQNDLAGVCGDQVDAPYLRDVRGKLKAMLSASPAPPPSNGCDGVGDVLRRLADFVEGEKAEYGNFICVRAERLLDFIEQQSLAVAPQPSASSAPEANLRERELAMLASTLIQRLRKANPVDPWLDKAWRILGKHGHNSLLREAAELCITCGGKGEVMGTYNPSGDPQDASDMPIDCLDCDATGRATTPTTEAGKIDEAMVERVAINRNFRCALTEHADAIDDVETGGCLSALEVTACNVARAALEAAGLTGGQDALSKLEWRIVANAGLSSEKRQARWAHVHEITAHGSSFSADMCRRAGFDPDEETGGDTDRDDSDDDAHPESAARQEAINPQDIAAHLTRCLASIGFAEVPAECVLGMVETLGPLYATPHPSPAQSEGAASTSGEGHE